MTGKTILGIIALCVFGLIILFVVRFALFVPNYVSPTLHTMEVCEQLGVCLIKYYEKADVSEKEIRTADVVEFLLNECGKTSYRLSTDPPFAPYDSVSDFSVYLLLPNTLENASPVLVAYTNPIKSRKGKSTVGLFLREKNPVAVSFGHYLLEEIVGRERVRQAKPDFYYWHGRYKERRKTKTVQ